jgi:membrane protein DedA with SNARE-associated domain
MEMLNKIWSILGSLLIAFAYVYVAYVAAFVQTPTNGQLADCILFAMCILLWRINAFQKSSNE